MNTELTTEKKPNQLEARCALLGIGNIRRHILLCAGEKCCSAETGQETWEWLKTRTRDDDCRNHGIYRTKTSCLRVCRDGPIAVVYPEGTWYKGVTKEVCERVVNEHLLEGKCVEEHIFAKNPL